MAFNLFLPAYPLDGGRILADVLLLMGLQPDLAAKITVAAAAVIGTGIVVWGLWPPMALLNAAVRRTPVFAHNLMPSVSAGNAGSDTPTMPMLLVEHSAAAPVHFDDIRKPSSAERLSVDPL